MIHLSVLPETPTTPAPSKASRGESTSFTGVVDTCFVIKFSPPSIDRLRRTSKVPEGALAAMLGLAQAISMMSPVGSTTMCGGRAAPTLSGLMGTGGNVDD